MLVPTLRTVLPLKVILNTLLFFIHEYVLTSVPQSEQSLTAHSPRALAGSLLETTHKCYLTHPASMWLCARPLLLVVHIAWPHPHACLPPSLTHTCYPGCYHCVETGAASPHQAPVGWVESVWWRIRSASVLETLGFAVHTLSKVSLPCHMHFLPPWDLSKLGSVANQRTNADSAWWKTDRNNTFWIASKSYPAISGNYGIKDRGLHATEHDQSKTSITGNPLSQENLEFVGTVAWWAL